MSSLPQLAYMRPVHSKAVVVLTDASSVRIPGLQAGRPWKLIQIFFGPSAAAAAFELESGSGPHTRRLAVRPQGV